VLYDTTKPLLVIAAITVIVLLASETILGQLSSLRLIGSRGKVKVIGVGVYWDANCTRPVDYLDWGSIEPSSIKNQTVFIRNEGNGPSTLFLNTTNWNPASASDYITLNWDYNGYIINPQETTKVTLTLSVASVTGELKDFSFDIIIGING
jgi:hypothetical protein